MYVFAASLISFFSIAFLFTHVGKKGFRRLLGYKGILDVCLHATILYLFFGTSTDGFLQAELCAIMFSIFLRLASSTIGYEKLTRRGWVRHAGWFERKFV